MRKATGTSWHLEGLKDIMAEKWGSAGRVKWYNKT